METTLGFIMWTITHCATSEWVLLESFDPAQIQATDAALRVEEDKLLVTTGHQADWPGITLPAPSGSWDLSRYSSVALEVQNRGTNPVTVACRVDNPGADGRRNCVTGMVELAPGETATLRVPLPRELPKHLAPHLFGMRGYPGGFVKEAPLDSANVVQLILFIPRPTEDHTFAITRPRAEGRREIPTWASLSVEAFFPCIDEYGQFIHKDWPNKVRSPEDLRRHADREAADLRAHPGPADWDSYGGWKTGPTLEATGYFRVQKYQGKWWLVDPDGHLFWSHGIDCVHSSTGTTPITDRKHWFRALPESDDPLAIFYGRGSWAPHGYYQGKSYETYNFTGANLWRKYGERWAEVFADITHRRLRSWGMNTIANWSDPAIYLMRRTPYVVAIHSGGRSLEGSEGYWGKFPDVFDPSFMELLRQRMAQERGKSAGDPWCIGYFVDNELSWGDEVALALATLRSPADQPAKRVFLEDLKAQYATIEALNQAWGTAYASWEALLQSDVPPDRERAYDDLTAFTVKFAETYFRQCRQAIKEIAPNQLYLGCRFAWANPLVVAAAAKYCDVISYNLYRRDIRDFRLPGDLDRPVIVGEFHFGALDRGLFHTGLQPTANQEERAEAYRNYVQGALENPLFVGTHWFQYGDQATTGRGDGENYQIGFLDIADTPYWETIAACRRVGYALYPYRLGR